MNIWSLVFSWILFCIYYTPVLSSGYRLKKIKCLRNWWPVFKRTYKILLNEKLLQLCLILAIFLCLLLELISQPGQTLLKFKGSGGKSNDFSLLWILNVAIFVCSSIICFHMLLKTYESFRPNSGSRLEEWWYFWLLLLELCHPNYLHTILCQGTFYQIIWKSLV